MLRAASRSGGVADLSALIPCDLRCLLRVRGVSCCYFASIGAPVICASKAATAEWRLSGMTFA